MESRIAAGVPAIISKQAHFAAIEGYDLQHAVKVPTNSIKSLPRRSGLTGE
jgi:hypothetical protein